MAATALGPAGGRVGREEDGDVFAGEGDAIVVCGEGEA